MTLIKTGARRAYLQTPLGFLEVIDQEGAIVEVRFVKPTPSVRSDSTPCLAACISQLDEYFGGRRRRFNLNLKPQGTAFERSVWDELLKIPFGETSTYGRIAEAIGRSRAGRAVGGANGKNPIAVIVPCHRVIGGDGSLTGYGGGLWRKEWLLTHEHAAFKSGR